MDARPQAEHEHQRRTSENLALMARFLTSGRAVAWPEPGEAPADARQLPVDRARAGRRSAAWGLGATLLALLAKGKGLLVFLLKSPFLLTLGSMALFVWAEAQRAGWAFAVGFVALIFIHEMGHAVAIKWKGLRAGWPVFIPFVGALITLKDQPQDALVDAQIGIAGPLAGGAAAFGCAAIHVFTGTSSWLALAMVGMVMNLFNLLPIAPMDGGRVIGAISRRLQTAGLLLLVPAMLILRSPILLLIGVMALGHVFNSRRTPDQKQRFFSVPTRWRVAMAALYFGWMLALGTGIVFAGQVLGPGAGL